MLRLRRISRQLQRGEDRPQEEPVAKVAAQQIGVLALPAQPGRLRQRFLHHRSGIDKHLDLATPRLDQPAPKPLQPPLDQIVVVLPLGIDTDRPPVALPQHGQRIALRRIDLGEHDDRPRIGPERRRTPAPLHPLGHPAHLPLPPCGEPGPKPSGRLGRRIGRADTDPGRTLPPLPATGAAPSNPKRPVPLLSSWQKYPTGVRGCETPGLALRNPDRHNVRAAGNPAPGRPEAAGSWGAT